MHQYLPLSLYLSLSLSLSLSLKSLFVDLLNIIKARVLFVDDIIMGACEMRLTYTQK